MALDTYASLHNKVKLRAPSVSSLLARDWISHAFRRVAERRLWSWLISPGQMIFPAIYTDGTVTLTHNSAAVVGAGTVFTDAMVGLQFTSGNQNPVYTIIVRTDGTNITLDQPWGGGDDAGAGFQIFRAYHTVPTDFHAFISVWDPRFNWQLNLDVTQEELNRYDAQRANEASSSYAVVNHSYGSFDDAGAAVTPPLPRYEIWPHQKSEYVYPYLYETRATDLEDSGATLPRYIRGDIILEMALAEAARWPGADNARPNSYHNLKLAEYHDVRAERMIMRLELQDDNVYVDDVNYQSAINMPYAPLPWVDASWMQNHDWGL